MGVPLRVELVGLFPEFYKLCPRGVGYACGLETDAAQLRDYPPDVQEQGQMLQRVYGQLMRDYGERIMPVSVGVASLRGLLLSLRYRLDSRNIWVVAGGRAVPVQRGYAAVSQAVAEALRAR